MDQATKDAFTSLTKTVEHGFSALADDIADVRTELKADIAALRTELKGDIMNVAQQVASIERDLKSIRRDLNDLADKVENITGYRKEIDHALERIAAIERHLGIRPNLAA